MKDLVTGHHGYIGSVLAAAVVAGGLEVVGHDTCLDGGCEREER